MAVTITKTGLGRYNYDGHGTLRKAAELNDWLRKYNAKKRVRESSCNALKKFLESQGFAVDTKHGQWRLYGDGIFCLLDVTPYDDGYMAHFECAEYYEYLPYDN